MIYYNQSSFVKADQYVFIYSKTQRNYSLTKENN